jgi:hypothetical protein
MQNAHHLALRPVPPHHGHVAFFEGVRGRAWRQRRFPDGAHCQVEEICEYRVALAVVGQAAGTNQLASWYA